MIRTNLATRPFEDENAVRGWLGVAMAIVVAATVFNVSNLVRYARSDSALRAQAVRDEARAAALRTSAARLRVTVDAANRRVAADDTQEAQELITRRTFSWTELFNQFETTLPADARIASVRPRVRDANHIMLEVAVVARSVEDVDRFLRNLEGTGVFTDVLSRDERINEAGQVEALVEVAYVSPRPAAGGAEQGKVAP